MSEFYTIENLMLEDEFWQIVESSLLEAQSSTDHMDEQQEAQYSILKNKLSALSWQKIIEFYNRYLKLFFDAYDEKLWCAGYIMMGGCGDDAFMDFRAWLIAQGKEVYYNALRHPDSLADVSQVTKNNDFYVFEGFPYAIATAFEEKYGKDIQDYITLPESHKNTSERIVFSWQEDEIGSMKAICPKLFKMFW